VQPRNFQPQSFWLCDKLSALRIPLPNVADTASGSFPIICMNIFYLPVIKFFCEGKEVGEIVGYLPQDPLKKEIENIYKNAQNCLANNSITK